MNDTLMLLARHGGAVLFGIVFIEQMGVPIPASPLLISAGALVAAGQLDGGLVLAAAALGSLLADVIWFQLGRIRGDRMLNFIRRLPFGSDLGVERAQQLFSLHGMKAVVAAKFVPGLSTVMPPLAGILKVPLRRFVSFASFGSLLYTSVFLAIGYWFSNEWLVVVGQLGRMSYVTLAVIIGLMVLLCGLVLLRSRQAGRRLPSTSC